MEAIKHTIKLTNKQFKAVSQVNNANAIQFIWLGILLQHNIIAKSVGYTIHTTYMQYEIEYVPGELEPKEGLEDDYKDGHYFDTDANYYNN